MVFGFFRKRQNPAVYILYNAIVEQARNPHFYSRLRVGDTIDGRFDMIILHAFLVFYRLRGEGAAATSFGQEVFDLFFQDMDRNLREMGVGDVSVPKKIKKMASMFYGRAAVYSKALDDKDHDALAAAIDRNLFADVSDPMAAGAIADYMEASVASLSKQTADDILAGRVAWVDATSFTA